MDIEPTEVPPEAPPEAPPPIPYAPMNGQVTYASSSAVTILWEEPAYDGGSPITTYLLSLTSEDQPAILHVIQPPTCSYYLDNIPEGVTILATVQASNDNGVIYGPELVFPLITYIHIPPAPPASAEVVENAPGIATITWTPPAIAPEGTAYYLVASVSSNPNDPIREYRTADMTQIECSILTLNPDSEYYFTVEIVNQVGHSPTVTTNLTN